jgi:uncharacterized membrane protein (UPF0136 family)
MNLGTVAAIAYGILSLIGGVTGYAKASSKASLISGIISGLLLLVGGIAQQQGAAWGLPLSAIVTIALIIVFTIRLLKTRKFMPSGIMLLAGAVALAGMLLPTL